MPTQHVHGTTVPVVIERPLDGRLPARLGKEPNHQVDEVCVRGDEQSVQAFAVPPDANVEVGAEYRTGGFKISERKAAQGAALDPPVL